MRRFDQRRVTASRHDGQAHPQGLEHEHPGRGQEERYQQRIKAVVEYELQRLKHLGSGRLGPMNRPKNPRSWTDCADLTTHRSIRTLPLAEKRAFEILIPRHHEASWVSEIHQISGHREGASADVIFVHGLGGHWRDTWAVDPARDETYWPNWLAHQLPAAEIWSVEYEANRSNWRVGMSMVEHADQILELLLTGGFGARPILFVTHSLGGLVVKSLLRASCDAVDQPAKQIAHATRGVAFFATPNSGARIASNFTRLLRWIGPLGQLYRTSGLLEELRAHGPELLKLNRWYRDHVSDRLSGLNISTKVYYEKRGAALGMISIVDEASADPGIGGVRPIPVSADHFAICTFPDHASWLYKRVLQFLSECLNEKSDGNASVASGGRKVIELALIGRIPSKVRFEIDTNIIGNENVTVLLTHSSGGQGD